MMAVSEEALASFKAFKDAQSYDFIILRMSNDVKTLVVAKCVDKGESEKVASFSDKVEGVAGPAGKVYKNFVTHLTEGDNVACGIVDVGSAVKGQRPRFAFIIWIPDSAPHQQRMAFTTSKEKIIEKFVFPGAVISVSNISELMYSNILSKS